MTMGRGYGLLGGFFFDKDEEETEQPEETLSANEQFLRNRYPYLQGEAVTNPYAATTRYDPKAEPLAENDPRKYYALDPRADSMPGPQKQGVFSFLGGIDELASTISKEAIQNIRLPNAPFMPSRESPLFGFETLKPNPESQQAIADIFAKESTVPFYKGQGDSILPGKEVLDRLKNASVTLNEINEEGSVQSSIVKGFTNPINYVSLGILGSTKNLKLLRNLALGSNVSTVDNPAVYKSLILKIPAIIAGDKNTASAVQGARLELLDATMNKPMNIEGLPKNALFENDFKFWLNMSNDEVVDTAKMFDEMGGAIDPNVTLTMSGVDGILQRLVKVGLIEKTGKYTFKKRVSSGSPEAISILNSYGKSFAVSGGSGTDAFVFDIPTMESVVKQIVTAENPALANLAKSTGINPSAAKTTPTEKAVIAYLRQESSIDELIEVTLQAGLDSHAGYKKLFGKLPVGIGKIPIKIDKDGIVLYADGKVKVGLIEKTKWKSTGTVWNDVFSDPKAFADDLSDAAMAYINDYQAIVDQIEKLRVAHGLKSVAKDRNGLYYIPRQVDGIDDIPILRDSNSHQARTYELATEGMVGHYDEATGTFVDQATYLADPRQTLKIHLKAAYREILDDQLATHLIDNNIGTTVTDALEEIAPKVVGRFNKATKAVANTKKKLKQLNAKLPLDPFEVDPSLMKTRSTLDWNQRKIKGYKALNDEIEATRKQLGKDEAELGRAKAARTKQLKSLRKAGAETGSIFGDAPENIGIKVWRDKIFKQEDWNELQKLFDSKYGDSPWKVLRVIDRIGQSIRFLSSGFDLGAPFIHGLPVLFRHPDVWRKATAAHYAAFFDPSVQSRMIRDNLQTYQEMAYYGIPIGDVEIFSAIKRGGGLNPTDLEKMLAKKFPSAANSKILKDTMLGKGIKGTYRGAGFATGQVTGRFQASYSSFLASSRMLMYKGMRDSWLKSGNADSTLPELAAYIRNMTGGLDSRALGVSANIRAIESTWLAFSPRLLRSTFALVSDAVSYLPSEVKGKITGKAVASARQQAAFKALGAYLVGSTGLYLSAELSLGLAKGHSMERIGNDMQQGLNPLNGSKFLSVEIGGQNIGIGGQIRAITQLMGAVGSTFIPGGKDFKDLFTGDVLENPILQYLSYRGAVGVNAFRTILEGTSGVDAQPFDKVDSKPDIAWHLFENSLPFALQGAMEGDNAWGIATGMLGLRTSPQSGNQETIERYKNYWDSLSIQEREKYGMLKSPTKKSDMSLLFRQAAEEADPEIAEAEKRSFDESLERGDSFGLYKDKRNTLQQEKDQKVQESFNEHGFSKQFREDASKANLIYATQIKSLNETNEELLSEFDEENPNQHPFNIAVDEYFTTLEAPGLEKVTGEFDFNEYDKRLEQLQESEIVEPYFDQIVTFLRNNKSPIEQELDRDREKLRPYWDIIDAVVEEENFVEEYEIYNSQTRIKQISMLEGAVPSLNWSITDSINLQIVKAKITEKRNTLKLSDPVIEALLWKHGYSTTKARNMKNFRAAMWIATLNAESGNNPKTADIEKFIQEHEAGNP
jgi:hypothetical protein